MKTRYLTLSLDMIIENIINAEWSADNSRAEIVTQIAELSKLLGMMPSDDVVVQKAGEDI